MKELTITLLISITIGVWMIHGGVTSMAQTQQRMAAQMGIAK